MAATKEISMDAAKADDLSELDAIFTLKEKVSLLQPTGLW